MQMAHNTYVIDLLTMVDKLFYITSSIRAY